MKEIEHYLCNQCGTKFEVTPRERITTFILHKPQEWQCPTCGRTCFALKEDDFKTSNGGKF